jgi:hypothetical protein
MKAYFEEKQRYTQWWLWLIIILAATVVIAIYGNGMYVQFVEKKPWGDKPMSDDALLIAAMFMISIMVLMLLLFFNSVLEIVVDRGSISYRLFPIIRKWKRIERENIKSYEIKRYYMKGYGVHRDLHGNRVINIKGHIGLELVTFDGSKLMLGTQRPEELLEAVNRMKKGSDD